MLNKKELLRYARSLPIIGKEGQEQLKSKKILIVGLGGLGSPASLYLAASGVGTLGLCDFDTVQESNLPRQILHTTPGQEKTKSASSVLEKINPFTQITLHKEKLTEKNAPSILEQYDIILDCSDDLDTKHLLNHVCSRMKKPLVYAAAVGEEGQLAVLIGEGCLACFSPRKNTPSPSCSSEGVIPTVPGLIGILQAGEALKLALGRPPMNGLLTYSFQTQEFKTFFFKKNPSCPVCSGNNKLPESKNQAMEISEEITPKELAPLLAKESVQLIDVREGWEAEICQIEGSHLIPLGSLETHLSTLDKEKPIVTYCHTGMRSLQAARLLKEKGFHARSLQGGIARWTDEIEPDMQRY